MKMNYIIILLIGSIVVYFLMKKVVTKIIPVSTDKIQKILSEIKSKYGSRIAKQVEQIYRLETANFTSKQFIGTNSAGMMKFAPNFPYGWHTMFKVFWSTNPDYAPIGTKGFIEAKGLDETGGGMKEFLVFKNLKAAMVTLAEFIKYYGNAGRWYSTELNKQNIYVTRLNQITTIYT